MASVEQERAWKALCEYVRDHLVLGRAVTVPGLGSFYFDVRRRFLGTQGLEQTSYLTFGLAQLFALQHGVRTSTAQPTGSVRQVPVSYTHLTLPTKA